MNLPINCITIPAEMPFLGTLAGWLLETYGQDPAVLPRLTVLLPGRRASRSLREAFLQKTEGKPLLLPRMLPIGELTEDSLWLHGPQAEILPAMPPLRRELMLTGLVHDFNHAREYRQLGRTTSIEQSLQLARQLARFLDEMAREGLSFENLENLVPEEYSRHWQETVRFLHIISHQWPGILAEEGCADASAQRAAILDATAVAWRKGLPGPVVAAGITSAAPAVLRLLAVVAR
ncbi:MAG: double-strand break repair protein AddB, partial [Proteobacteria bacterium]|nr:double-strand break repair protein AddB [Pseudomonadota bacterium]